MLPNAVQKEASQDVFFPESPVQSEWKYLKKGIYSCLSDSIGSILAARYAGYKPKAIPTSALMPNANTNELAVITVGI